MAETTADVVTATWRAESARLVGALTRMTGDLDLAEDLAQDALVSALEAWPSEGIPDNAAAWLMTIARRRAVDTFRRSETLRRKVALLGHALHEESGMPDLTTRVDFIEDDALRLIFLTCHPRLSPQSRAALTLRLVGGLTTGEIARAFLTTESTMGQRISRAKRTLSATGVDLELPIGPEREARLEDVMAVVYLIFNAGYTAAAGPDWMRPELTHEAIRLCRMLADLAPTDPEVHGLQALLELQASRSTARVDRDGRPVLLEDQDRTLWDGHLIRRGLAALARAEALGAAGAPVGRYVLQAAIASQHARAGTPEQTDWPHIARLYDLLAEAAPGPIVEVNRAVAYGRAQGPRAGLAVLDGLPDDALPDSHLLPGVRADLLARAGRRAEAAALFRAAAALTTNDGEQVLLRRRAEECERGGA